MALSEHEERILQEIERQLAEDDPRFVARARRRGSPAGESGTRIRLAVLGIVAGFILLLGLTFHVAFGVIGIALLFVSTLAAIAAVRDASTAAGAAWRDRMRRVLGGHENSSS